MVGRGLLSRIRKKDKDIARPPPNALPAPSEAGEGAPRNDTPKPVNANYISISKREPLSKAKLQELLSLIVEKVAQLPEDEVPPVDDP